MKKILALLLALFLLPLSGCAFSQDALEALLEAPRLSERQTEIYNALTDAVGRNFLLKYPKDGENRSAFLLHDLDGTPGEEALAFYQTQAQDAFVHIFFFDTDEDNEWHGVANISVEGNEIDKVMFANLFGNGWVMLAGAQGENKTQRSLWAYQYLDGNISMIYTASYIACYVTDIDADGLDELFLFRLSDEQDSLRLTVVQEVNGELHETDELVVGNTDLSLLQMQSGQMTDGRQALYVDYVQSSGAYYTDLYYWEDGHLTNGMAEQELRRQTARTVRQSCRDLQGDSIYLIPQQRVMAGYDEVTAEDPYWTYWQSFDPIHRQLSVSLVTCVNLSAGYALRFTEQEAEQITFSALNETDEAICTEAATGGEIFRVRLLKKSERDEMPADYAEIGSFGQYLYIAQILNQCSEGLTTDIGRLRERFMIYN